MGDAIHVVNIQAAEGGTACYVNLGAHLAFLPTAGGAAVDPSSILEYQCAFRDRIDPPPGPAFPWAYVDDPEAASESIEFVLSEWQSFGRRFFGRYGDYPEAFRSLLADETTEQAHPAHLLTLARIALQLTDERRAKRLATAGLARVPERATLLRRDLLEITRRCTGD
jgi:hypothetical protein